MSALDCMQLLFLSSSPRPHESWSSPGAARRIQLPPLVRRIGVWQTSPKTKRIRFWDRGYGVQFAGPSRVGGMTAPVIAWMK